VVRIFQASDRNLRVNIGIRWSVCDTNEPLNFIVCTPRNRVVDRSITQAERLEERTPYYCVLFLFETSEEKTCRENTAGSSLTFRRTETNDHREDVDRFGETG